MRNSTGKSIRDQKGHSISPGMMYYEDGFLNKKVHCLDCYLELTNHGTSSVREEVEDEVSDIGSMAFGAALGSLGDDDSSSSFGEDDSSSSDSGGDFDGGDFDGGGGGGDA